MTALRPAHIGEVRGDDGQHTGAQEADNPGGQRDEYGGQQSRVDQVKSKHDISHNLLCPARHLLLRVIPVTRLWTR